jgi:hypothetical protein
MNELTIIYDNICSLIHENCHLKSYHSGIKHHMTLNITFSVAGGYPRYVDENRVTLD